MARAGRPATGLTRPRVLQIALNEEENEFVARFCIHNNISAAELGRKKLLKNGWRKELDWLRKEQKNAPLEQLDGRHKR